MSCGRVAMRHRSSGARKTWAGVPSRYSITTECGAASRSGSGTSHAAAQPRPDQGEEEQQPHGEPSLRDARQTHGDGYSRKSFQGPDTSTCWPASRAQMRGSYMASASTGGSVNLPAVTARTA